MYMDMQTCSNPRLESLSLVWWADLIAVVQCELQPGFVAVQRVPVLTWTNGKSSHPPNSILLILIPLVIFVLNVILFY